MNLRTANLGFKSFSIHLVIPHFHTISGVMRRQRQKMASQGQSQFVAGHDSMQTGIPEVIMKERDKRVL
jgi:hypothetical protein